MNTKILCDWMEKHNINMNVCMIGGRVLVSMGWKHVISYSDSEGEHSESWEVSRSGDDLWKTVLNCMIATRLPLCSVG